MANRPQPATIDSDTRLEGDKRIVPQFLQKLLKQDVILTKKFVSFLLNFVQIRSFKTHCKFLEWSCHGVVWLVCLIAFTYMFDNKSLYQMQVNLFMALIIDIFAVAIIKAITRRRRPSANDDPFCIGPDVYSFPSGHASRSTLIFFFFTTLFPVSFMFWGPLFAWWFSICISRMLLFRHHILDVLGGVFVGTTEALLMAFIWVGPEKATSLVNWISDDRVSGSD
ncbi:unnamed protein product, partial [Diamesa serratosioi]